MKLYYLAGACSTAAMISLLEAGQKFDAVAVDRGTKRTADGNDFNQINPKGYVPALVLDNGDKLSENVAILTYIASLDKSATLGPAIGTASYYHLLEWLAYLNSEVHKNFSPLFRPNLDDAARAIFRENLIKRLGYIEQQLSAAPFLMGQNFTVADAYLYVALSWRGHVGVDISALPQLTAFYERVRARPSVSEAYRIQGL
ncbi:MAG: glutathione transferase GstA [Pseudomonadales bacterium]|jgi:glutathione S-transferase|nr:glutathione transferase GstA [Pseudomonadales bacterium]